MFAVGGGMSIFVNRKDELEQLGRSTAGLIVLFGRRRVGKTTLIERWGRNCNLHYSQAIEGAEPIQISQLLDDLSSVLPQGLRAESWKEFFPILSLIKEDCVIAIDEFPYLVKSQPSLPSRLQKWMDHDRPPHVRLVLLGSSQTMMNSIFLNSSAPLYERADLILHISPMGYRFFCEAVGLDPMLPENFEKFSLVGGVPRYWSYIDKNDGVTQIADKLFFSKSALLESEPDRLLRDEDVNGMQAKSIFECIGRGANKSSEIASRMGIEQTALSKPLQLLMHASLINRSLPFGESPRSSKRTLYSIADFALTFWYGSYSPHRSRWHLYDQEQKQKIIHDHAALVLEECYRNQFPDGSRYWEGQHVEIDCVRNSRKPRHVIITEIKHRPIQESEASTLKADLEEKFARSKLAGNFKLDHVEVFGTKDVLARL
jgi:AAA+ ATPase superfamily predicted ATPase